MQLEQMQKMIERATAMDKKQGQRNNNRSSFVESAIVLLMDLPKLKIRNNAHSQRQQLNAWG
jgi:hypothetical protein